MIGVGGIIPEGRTKPPSGDPRTPERKGDMGQFYIDIAREGDAYSLPDAESFFVSPDDAQYNLENHYHDEGAITEPGWYWTTSRWSCLPDSDAFGPWPTEEAAIEDARGSLP